MLQLLVVLVALVGGVAVQTLAAAAIRRWPAALTDPLAAVLVAAAVAFGGGLAACCALLRSTDMLACAGACLPIAPGELLLPALAIPAMYAAGRCCRAADVAAAVLVGWFWVLRPCTIIADVAPQWRDNIVLISFYATLAANGIAALRGGPE